MLGPGCLAACDPLWHPEIPCRTVLDRPNIKISDSGGLVPFAWMLAGLEEVTEVTEVMEGLV